jgi:hypothetical protein
MGWDHKAYEGEARLRMTAAQRQRHPETDITWKLEPLDERERLMVESAYRRGCAQGFYFCFDALARGVPRGVLARVYARIEEWRRKRHGGALLPPPTEALFTPDPSGAPRA